MKSHILFVDDEPLVLQGLKRSLRSKRKDWEMTFVDSGEHALMALEHNDYDVVVTDMRMPSMNGVELLSEVKRRSPGTLRIILSGFADKDLIMKSVKDTHQFLSKPCDPSELSNIIQRVSSAQQDNECLQNNTILSQLTHIPTLPETYSNLIEQLEQPNSTIEEIGRTIEQDPAMTADLLKIVNSAYFGIRREISSAAEAATYLGTDTIKSLLLLSGIFDQCDFPLIDGFSPSDLREHCLKTAALARRLTFDETHDKSLADEAYLGGTLHDLGKLIFATNDPMLYQTVVKYPKESPSAESKIETETFGADHATVAGLLFRLWGLSESIVDAVMYHHQPHRVSHRDFCALTSVYVSNLLVRNPCLSYERQEPRAKDYLAELGLQSEWQAWLDRYTNL